MKKILIIEDEEAIRMALEDDFQLEGYEVEVATDGLDGWTRATNPHIDLIILDIMLPGMDGFELCRKLRAQGIKTPVIMLTAKGQEIDRILGLEFGADDYVTKPFSPRELQARVKAVLRRTDKKSEHSEKRSFRSGDLEVDYQRYECRLGGREINLTMHEFELLTYLIKHRDRVIHRDELLDEVWGKEVVVSIRTIDTHMTNLRKKLGDHAKQGKYIISKRGVGYRFSSQ